MIHTRPVLLLSFVIISQICSGCQDDCCNSSKNCCELTECFETTSCCQQNNCCHQNNCCQQDNHCQENNQTKCCQTTNCQRCNCLRICDTACKIQSCSTQCKRRCCQDEDGVTPSTPTTSTTEKIIVDGSSSSNINNGSVQATISITNNLTNVNTIHIPINVTNENSLSIRFISIPTVVGPVTQIPNVSSTPSGPITTTPCPTPYTETVPVAVPVPVYIPVYRTIPFPIYVNPQQGCCRVISPCVSNQTWNCNPYQTMCGTQCTHNTMFAVTNPCENGCYKKPYAPVRFCTVFGYCQVIMRNCDLCRDDFYTNYNNYLNCGGCFYN